jgi:GNAT superfamily N-acetyltransferase
MEIRAADMADQAEIISLYERSQDATLLPDPVLSPRHELGKRLYDRPAIERYVAIESGKIIGHALIEPPNQNHVDAWRQTLKVTNLPLIEMGGAFVDPMLSGRGIWTSLLLYRIELIRKHSAIPVTATWSINEHVMKTFLKYGGVNACQRSTSLGEVALFVF